MNYIRLQEYFKQEIMHLKLIVNWHYVMQKEADVTYPHFIR